jgi:hypothetical protein
MKHKEKLIGCSVLIAVVINIVLPMIATPFATKEEAHPSNGAHNLSFKGQIMHMLVHHGHVPISSSLIVAVIVGISVCLGSNCAK